MKLFRLRKGGYGALSAKKEERPGISAMGENDGEVPDAMPSDESSGSTSNSSQPPHIVPRASTISSRSGKKSESSLKFPVENRSHMEVIAFSDDSASEISAPIVIRPPRGLESNAEPFRHNLNRFYPNNLSTEVEKPRRHRLTKITVEEGYRIPSPGVETTKSPMGSRIRQTSMTRRRAAARDGDKQRLDLDEIRRRNSSFTALFTRTMPDDDAFTLDTPSFYSESTLETQSMISSVGIDDHTSISSSIFEGKTSAEPSISHFASYLLDASCGWTEDDDDNNIKLTEKPSYICN